MLKKNAGLDVASLDLIATLPRREYLIALAYLESFMETDIPKEVTVWRSES
jgi:hypothetical protein